MAKEKRRIHKKTCNNYQNPDTPSFRTGDYSKQLRPCLYVVQNFQFEIFIGGKIDCYQNFICLFFPSKNNKAIKSK